MFDLSAAPGGAGPAPTATRRMSFYILSRLYVQPDGRFLARPAGIYKAYTLDQALATATYQANTSLPMLLRCDVVLPLLEFQISL